MGYQVGMACYSDAGTAADALFSTAQPVPTSSGYSVFEKVGSNWQLDVYQNGSGSGAVLVSSSIVSPQLPTCDPVQQVTDGLYLGWLTVLPVFTVWAVMVIKKALNL